MNKIILIRHAQTDTAGIRLTGRAPGIFLNAEGREQARILAEKLADAGIDYFYSSPLERTMETANLIAEKHKQPVSTLDNFLEVNYGEWTNFTVEELRGNPLFDRYNTYRSNTRIPGGEKMEEVQTRTIAGIEKVCLRHPGSAIAIFTHADVIKMAISWYLSVPVDMMHRMEISPASVSIIELYDDSAKVIKFNQTINYEI
ncbi:MAG TPA: histidine phosphatase family protein [Bacteroidales bacterium]|jgi:probable phosphoglycerate mutase|nr:histidine phosphatase family protein [Bacteroidales bacterium]